MKTLLKRLYLPLLLLSQPSYATLASLDEALRPYVLETLLILRCIPAAHELVQSYINELMNPPSTPMTSSDQIGQLFIAQALEEHEEEIMDSHLVLNNVMPLASFVLKVHPEGVRRFQLNYNEFLKLRKLSPSLEHLQFTPGVEISLQISRPLFHIMVLLAQQKDTSSFIKQIPYKNREILRKEAQHWRCRMAFAELADERYREVLRFLAWADHPEFGKSIIFSSSIFLQDEHKFKEFLSRLNLSDPYDRKLLMSLLTQWVSLGFPEGMISTDVAKMMFEMAKEHKFPSIDSLDKQWEEHKRGEEIRVFTDLSSDLKEVFTNPFLFENYRDEKIAAAFTEWHLNLFHEIKLSELRMDTKKFEEAKSLHRITDDFRDTLQFLKDVLATKNGVEKIIWLKRFIRIGNHLRQSGNFHGALLIFFLLQDYEKLIDGSEVLSLEEAQKTPRSKEKEEDPKDPQSPRQVKSPRDTKSPRKRQINLSGLSRFGSVKKREVSFIEDTPRTPRHKRKSSFYELVGGPFGSLRRFKEDVQEYVSLPELPNITEQEKEMALRLFTIFKLSPKWDNYQLELRELEEEHQAILPAFPILTILFTQMSTKMEEVTPLHQAITLSEYLRRVHLKIMHFTHSHVRDRSPSGLKLKTPYEDLIKSY